MIEIKDITYTYDNSIGNTIENISFDIKQNECVAILGNNGAGKSTLLKCIDRIYSPQRGIVLVDGLNIYKMSRGEVAQKIAYVPQNNKASRMTVFDSILLGRKPYIKWDAGIEDKEKVLDIIEKMNLRDLMLRDISQLSGGELQKVVLARALAQEPRLLLLDEPTSNLDPRNQHDAMMNIKRIAKEHSISVAIIIHDLNLAIRYCDKFLLLRDSEVFAYGGIEVITTENIEAVYNMHAHVTEYMGIPLVVPFPNDQIGRI